MNTTELMAESLKLGLADACKRIAELETSLAKAERTAILYADILDRQCIAMQAALIEQSIGKGDEAALEWISNTLDGPGLLPSMSDAAHLPKTKDDGPAQAWFDAKMVESEAFRAAHPAPDIAAVAQA